jgi:hypothetical protein
MSISFHEWSAKWTERRQYTGTQILDRDLPLHIRYIQSLWHIKLPLAWERKNWAYLKQRGFRRGDKHDPQPEHKLEKKLFARPAWVVKGGKLPMYLYPELNEISFGNQGHGQRKIDVLAVLKIGGRTIPLAIEMKGKSTNNCWFAVVENLQQLRLLHSYPQSHMALMT